jgi:hypothetical protein
MREASVKRRADVTGCAGARRAEDHRCRRKLLNNRRESVAETNFSTSCAPPSQEARLSRTHEEPGWTQSPCAAPQERAPQPYACLIRRGRNCRASAGWCAALSMMRCTGKAGGGRAASSRYFFAPMASTTAGSDGASKRRWAMRCVATGSGAAYEKF